MPLYSVLSFLIGIPLCKYDWSGDYFNFIKRTNANGRMVYLRNDRWLISGPGLSRLSRWPAMHMNNHELTSLYEMDEFPLSAKYDMGWVHENEMGPNVLWMTEALTRIMDLEPGMRVLDIGCGTAMSSIFLAKEYDVQVWATDLWIDATDNWMRIRKTGLEDRVFPIHAPAQNLPFAEEFFDVIVSLDSFHYFGTDVHCLEFFILKLLKRGGQIGIISPASLKQLPTPLPDHFGPEWYWMNSIDWWRHHWERFPELDVKVVEQLPNGWDLWVRWHEFLEAFGSRNRPEEAEELDMLRADGGEYLGFVRMLANRKK